MVSVLAYVALMAVAVLSEEFYGDIQEDVATFHVTLGRDEPIQAALRSNREYLSDSYDFSTAKKQFEVVPDTPWKASRSKTRKVLLSSTDVRIETSLMRRERLRRGWEEAGCQFVATPSGERPIRKKEIAAARRAREMAADLQAMYAEGPGLGASTTQHAEANTPGFVRQWGMHIAVVVVALAMLAAVLKGLVLKKA